MGRAFPPSRQRSIPLAALALPISFLGALVLAQGASGSQLVDRNATHVRLAVNARSQALITYRASGRFRRVLAWGGLNARHPAANAKQVSFRLDYSGGWGTYHRRIWNGFPNTCGRYTGPVLPDVVASCTASDDSHWVLQQWKVALPDLGFPPWIRLQKIPWLTLSHWSGPTAELEVYTDWVYSGRFEQVFGRLTYRGKPVYGYRTTHLGSPTDSFGRLVFLDTLNSKYGRGWRRENSFVTHKRTGVFCYGFFRFDPTAGGYKTPPSWPRHKRRGPGTGSQYRLTVMGPGVTPDVSVIVPGLHPFDRSNPTDVAYEAQQNAILDSFHDRTCRHH